MHTTTPHIDPDDTLIGTALIVERALRGNRDVSLMAPVILTDAQGGERLVFEVRPRPAGGLPGFSDRRA